MLVKGCRGVHSDLLLVSIKRLVQVDRFIKMTPNRQKVLILILGVIVLIELAFNYKQMQENNLIMEDMRFSDLQFARQSELEKSRIERKEHIKLCAQEVEMKIRMLKECKQCSLEAKDEVEKMIESNKKKRNEETKRESASLKFQNDLQKIIMREQGTTDKCFFKRKELGVELRTCKGSLTMQNKENVFRDQNFLDRIKSFVLFIGYARSGHSIVAALLDAHPHIAISHELNIMKRWETSYRNNSAKTRIDLFNEILNNTVETISGEKGFRSPNLTRKNTLNVSGLYQGKYEDYLQIIGDKKGDAVISFFEGPNIELNEFEEIQKFVGFPLKIIHIVRNPYDNIATKSLYGISNKFRKKVAKNETMQIENNKLIKKFTESHLKCYKQVPKFINYFGEDMLTIQHEDLIENPKLFLTRICNFLEISCSTHYLDKVSKLVFTFPTKSRYNVQWTEEMKEKVEQVIQQYDFLRGYSFKS